MVGRFYQGGEAARALIWAWKLPIAILACWLAVLHLVREYDEELAQLYVLLSFFALAFGAIGFTPRQEGELSAYSHFNKNSQRLLGDLDPARAGRELTGQSMFDIHQNHQHEEEQRRPTFQGQGNALGSSNGGLDDEDQDMQRAMLLSLRDAREARRKRD